MAKTIRQTVTLTASPEALFETYLDSEKHAAVIGDKVSISRKAGATFTAFDGGLRGRNLLIIPKRMIVQSWRASTWKKSDPDSLLILQFSKAGAGGQVMLTPTFRTTPARSSRTAGRSTIGSHGRRT